MAPGATKDVIGFKQMKEWADYITDEGLTDAYSIGDEESDDDYDEESQKELDQVDFN